MAKFKQYHFDHKFVIITYKKNLKNLTNQAIQTLKQ